MNERAVAEKYSLNKTKIVLPKARNIVIIIAALVFVGLIPQIWLKSILIIVAFPFILFAAVFASIWFLKIADVLVFWVKEVDFDAKRVNKKIGYEDFYLLEYKYSVSDRSQNRVFALLIFDADKNTNFKILCESDGGDKMPVECREFVKRCQERQKYIFLGGKKSVYRFKIGKRTYFNWSFFQRIFIQHIVWTALMLLFIPVCFYLVLPDKESSFVIKGSPADKISNLRNMPAGFVKKPVRR